MQFDLLCSGSKGNSCLIRHNNHSFLIDCGPSSKKYIVQALNSVGSSLEDIEAVLITHSHKDHTRQLPLFREIPVYSYCHFFFRDREKKPIYFNRIPIHPDRPFELFGITITPILLSHDAGPTVGYLLDDGKERLVYVTDTGYFKNRYHPMLRNATYYIFESNHDVQMLMDSKRPMVVKQRILSDEGHLNNEDSAYHLVQMAGKDTKQIILAHISQEANTPQKALEALQKAIKRSGRDLSHVELKAAGQFEVISSNKEESDPYDPEKSLTFPDSKS